MEIKGRWTTLYNAIAALCYLVSLNIRHYSLALFGFRLRLDPDYPFEYRVPWLLISDSVLEYRTYLLVVLWGIVLASLIHNPYIQTLIALFLIIRSFQRSYYYSSSLRFWRQAYKECPKKVRTQHIFTNRLKMEINNTKDIAEYNALTLELRNLLEAACPGIMSHMTFYTKPREGEKAFQETIL